MGVLVTVIQVLFFLGVPGLVLWGCSRSKVLDTISPVVLCYVLGIAFGNIAGLDTFGVEADAVMEPGELAPAEKTTELIASLGVILALGLLLVSTDFLKWLRLAPVTLLSAVLAMVAVVIVAGGSAVALSGYSDKLPAVAGMLVGVYTGGTVNLAAVAKAMDVDSVTWGVVHTSDVIVCGLWFLVLLAVGPRLFGLFLPPFKHASEAPVDAPDEPQEPNLVESAEAPASGPTVKSIVVAVLIGIGIAALPLVASQAVALFSKDLEGPVAILGATTLAIGLSFWPRVRRLDGLYETGDYLLLVFCVAVGSLATFSRLAGAELFLVGFTTLVVLGSVGMHALLCALFRIDRDTMIITSVAALYGPPFVPPVARALKNREILVSGVTTGLVGLAAGNYLGIAVAYAVMWIVGKGG